MTIAALSRRLRAVFRSLSARSRSAWVGFSARPLWQRIVIATLALALIIGAFMLLNGKKPEDSVSKSRTVTVATIAELSGTASSVDLIGTVRSVTEADILAQNGGTVRAVNTTLGGYVPAGSVIASLENAAERASVLQAEGAYDAAVAARSAQSLPDTKNSARTTYRTAYTTLDNALETQVDQFFGGPTAVGPELLITPQAEVADALSRERTRIRKVMEGYAANLSSADTRDPQTLLAEAESVASQVATFLTQLSAAANSREAQPTAAQTTALVAARASVDGVIATIQAARSGYRAGSVGASASADASVKQALGALRGAQANLERTVVRAPIGGQVNFLPIRVGDYVTPLMHVATVAQNGALEIVAYVSEGDRDLLAAGSKILVEDKYEGIITSIAPALDPTSKQIEVHIAVTGSSELVNGQSVHIKIPDLATKPTTVETPAGPVLLPLASVKLRAGDRIVFTVDENSRLVARPVEVGEVRGDRIEILSGISPELRIVTDARGLSEGELVETKSQATVR